MKTSKWIALGAVVLNLISGAETALAQPGSGVGGGRFSEQQLNDFFGELKTFFNSQEALDLYPEIKTYNDAHPEESFQEYIKPIKFKVVHKKVYFKGEERDCVPMVDGKVRWVECNAEYIPENTLDNQPTVYAFLAHEVFVPTHIEEPCGKYVPSTYEKSGRLADHRNLSLVTYTKWVPGSRSGKAVIPGIQCELASSNSLLTRGRRIILQAHEKGARILVSEYASRTGIGWNNLEDWVREGFRSKSAQRQQTMPYFAQVEYELEPTNETNFAVIRPETRERSGTFILKTSGHDEIKLIASTRAEDINPGMVIYVSRNGRIVSHTADQGSCAQISFSNTRFHIYSDSVLYGFTGLTDRDGLLKRTIHWLSGIRN